MKDSDIVLCKCHSPEHQVIIQYENNQNFGSEVDQPMCYLYVHLNRLPFWQRVKYGIKYIFGRQSKYGAFDEFIINPKDVDKFKNIVSHLQTYEKIK